MFRVGASEVYKIMPLIIIILLQLFYSSNVFGRKIAQACVLETETGAKMTIDCIERMGATEAELIEFCKSFANPPDSMHAPKANVRYKVECPEKIQASCKNSAGSRLNYHYYGRSPSSLKQLEITCKITNGVWIKSNWSLFK